MSPKKAHFPGVSPLAVLLALGLAGGARAASYTLRPEIDVEETHDDNVLSDEDEIPSWGSRIAPSIGLSRKSDTSDVSLQLGLTRRNTYSLSDIDGTDESATLSGRQNLSRRLSLGVRGNYQFYASYNAIEELNANGGSQILFSERPELTWQGLATDLTYEIDDSTELVGELEWNDWKYDQTTERSDLYNNQDQSFSLTLSRQLTALDKVGIVGSLSRSKEDNADDSFHFGILDLGSLGLYAGLFRQPIKNTSDLGTAMAFWQRAWSPRWASTLQAGIRTLNSDSDQQLELLQDPCVSATCFVVLKSPTQSNSGTGFVGGGNISHAYSDRGRGTFSYLHDTRTGVASSTGSSGIDTDSFSLTVNHQLSPRVSLSLNGMYLAYKTTGKVAFQTASGITAFADSGARTNIRTADVRLDWQLRKNFVAYTRFTYYDIDQERPLSSFDSNRVYARRVFGVGFRYFFDQEL